MALVSALACLAAKYGIEALQDVGQVDSSELTEDEKHERVRRRLNAMDLLYLGGIEYSYGGKGRVEVHLDLGMVLLESRMEPNPNYSPHDAAERDERPYIEVQDFDHVYEHYWTLRALWETGAVGDDYAEQRLNELTDLLTRKASANVNYYVAPESAEEQGGEPEEEQAQRF